MPKTMANMAHTRTTASRAAQTFPLQCGSSRLLTAFFARRRNVCANLTGPLSTNVGSCRLARSSKPWSQRGCLCGRLLTFSRQLQVTGKLERSFGRWLTLAAMQVSYNGRTVLQLELLCCKARRTQPRKSLPLAASFAERDTFYYIYKGQRSKAQLRVSMSDRRRVSQND